MNSLCFTFIYLSNSKVCHLFSGAVGARLSTDASTVRSLVGDTLALIVQNIATISAGLIIAFASNWILSFVILAVSPFIFLQGFLQMKFLKGFSADAKVSFLTFNFSNSIKIILDTITLVFIL